MVKLKYQKKIVVNFKCFRKYKDKVILVSSSMPLISPYDLKYNIYLLTKYYPEFIKNTYPWNEIEDYDKLIYFTYNKVKKIKHF